MRTESDRNSLLQPVTVSVNRQRLKEAFMLPPPSSLLRRSDMLLVDALPEAVPLRSGPRQSPLTRLPENSSEVEKVKLFAVLAQLKSWLSDVSPAETFPWQRMRSLLPFASRSVPEPFHCPFSISVIALAPAVESGANVTASETVAATKERRAMFRIFTFLPVVARGEGGEAPQAGGSGQVSKAAPR